MKRIITIAALGIVAFSGTRAFATPLAYEPFNQTNTAFDPSFPNDGSSIDGQPAGSSGFSGNYYNSAGAGVVTGSLSNPSSTSLGNKLGRMNGNINAYFTVAQFDTTNGGNFGTAGLLESSGGANTSGNNIGAAGTTLYFSFLYASASGDSPTNRVSFSAR